QTKTPYPRCSRFAMRSDISPLGCSLRRPQGGGYSRPNRNGTGPAFAKAPARRAAPVPPTKINRKNKNGALGFPLPFCGIIKRVPKKDVNLPFACEGDLSRKTDSYDKQQSPGSEQLE